MSFRRLRKDNALCSFGAACPCDSCAFEAANDFCPECEEVIDPVYFSESESGLCEDCDGALYEESISHLE